jgi:hypothetical protein
MSLINDALKKAERERGERSVPQTASPEPVAKPPRARRKQRYLRGFLLSLLIVGTLTTISTTYLVNQLLEDTPNSTSLVDDLRNLLSDAVDPIPEKSSPSEPASPAESANVSGAQAANEIAPTLPTTEPETPLASKDTSGEASTSSKARSELLQSTEPIADSPSQTPSGPDSDTPVSAAPENLVVVQDQQADFADSLRTLEIRGIMQSSGRVLIFDASDGRTRTYSVGDTITGLPDCTVLEIDGKNVRIGSKGLEPITLVFK